MRLIYNSDAKRLQKDFDDKTPITVAEMFRSERTGSVPLELFLVDNDGGYATPGTSDYEVVIGRQAQELTTGKLKLTFTGTTEEIDLSKPKLATRIEAALNAVSEINSAGGVDVIELNNGRAYQITFRSNGSRAAITAGVGDSMQPASALVSEVTAGTGLSREVQLLTLEEASLAEVGTSAWSANSNPALTISTLVEGTANTREVSQLSISGDPAPGSFFVVSNSEPISTEATAAQVKSILNSALSSDIGSVKKTGERIWQITYKTNGDKTALSAGTHNLVKRPSVTATLSLNTTALAYAANSDGSDLSIGFTLRKSNEVVLSEKINLSEPFAEVLGSSAMLNNDSIGALFSISSNDVGKGKAIALSGGLTYDGTTLNAPHLQLTGGTMSGAVAMGSQKITGLADGTASGDAINKGQLDGLIDNSPDALNTLNELAAALGNDVNFSTTVATNIATKLPLAGGTLTGNAVFNDGVKAIFGSSSDGVEIYHSDSNSYIDDTGSGDLRIKGSTIRLQSAGGEQMAVLSQNSSVALMFNDSKKFETTNTGLKIFGLAEINAGALQLDSAYALQWGNDNNRIFGSSGNNYIRFDTNGTEAARFDSSGNFLIPDTNKIKLGDDSDLEIFYDTDSFIKSSGVLKLASDTIRFLKNNLGEYTANFYGDAGVELFYNGSKKFETTNSGININGGITFDSTFTEIIRSSNSLRINIDNDGNQTDRIFIVSANSGMDELFRVQEDGKVGIGGTPSVPLHIKKDSSTLGPVLRLDNPSTSNLSQSGIEFVNTSTGVPRSAIYSQRVDNGYNSELVFYTSDTDTLQERVRIDHDGKFAIGGTPSGNLTIESSSNVIADINTTTANANTTIRLRENGSNKATIGYDGTNDGLVLTTGGFTAGNGIFINDSQNVGIGDSSPSQKMTIVGTSDTGIIQHIEGASDYAATTRYSRAGLYSWQIGIGGSSATGNNIPVSAFGIVEGADTRLTVATGGNVSIGNTNEYARLYVQGNSATLPAGRFYQQHATGDGLSVSTEGETSSEFALKVDSDGGLKPLIYARADGNVGIGTQSPSMLLDCQRSGNGEVAKFGDGTRAHRFYVDTATAILAIDGAVPFDVYTNGVSRMRIDTSGNVGIGGAPDKTFHIKTTAINTAFARIESTATNSYPTLSLKNDAREYQLTAHGGVSDSFVIYDGTVGANRFFINTDGDIIQNFINYTDSSNYEALKISAESDHIKYDTTSIGSFASNTREHRFNVNNSTKFRVSSSGVLNYGHYYIVGNYELNNSWNDLIFSTSTQTDNDIIFKPNNTEAVRITGSGRLGVGTSSPAYECDIQGTAGSLRVLSSGGGANIFLSSQAGNLSRIRWNGLADFAIRDDTDSADRFQINTDGDCEVCTDGKGLILNSADGTAYKITVANDGTITSTAV